MHIPRRRATARSATGGRGAARAGVRAGGIDVLFLFLTCRRRFGFVRRGFPCRTAMSRDRILRIIAYGLRFKIRYPGWRWPRDTEADTRRAAEALLEHIELSNCRVEAGESAKPHSTHGEPQA